MLEKKVKHIQKVASAYNIQTKFVKTKTTADCFQQGFIIQPC